jgi:nucleoside-diphosphate-sugar epimerase
MTTSAPATLVTGGTGFLGGLVAAALLAEQGRRLLLPIRAATTPGNCLERIRGALLDLGVTEERATDLLSNNTTVVELPPFDRFHDLDALVASLEVGEVVHCAGCVDYFEKKRLQLGNIDFTTKLLEASRRWGAERFVFVSTAYSGGYRAGAIPEALHPDPAPADEPTDYTWSKRTAERRIADSGVPFVIVRPSIVVGDSRTGKYTGKNYGLYQMWRAIEGLLCREYSPIWYTVAPPAPLNLIHQDAFQSGFLGIYRDAPPGAIVHLVSDAARIPTMTELARLWADVYCPEEIHAYGSVDEVPLRSIPRRQSLFLELAAKNFEISTHTWNFETAHLQRLRAAGLRFADATLDTIALCQRRYIEGSARIRAHMEQHAQASRKPTRLIEMHRWPRVSSGSTGVLQ